LFLAREFLMLLRALWTVRRAGLPKTSRRKAKQQDLAALIDQTVQFRSALHNLVQ
jgi:hypothetical protein